MLTCFEECFLIFDQLNIFFLKTENKNINKQLFFELIAPYCGLGPIANL